MTEQERVALADRTLIKNMTHAQRLSQLAVYTKYKIWSSRQRELDHATQNTLAARWVREDVFGHTFNA